MTAEKVYLAIDLGAESGRVMAGVWNGRKMRLVELHRFPNGPVNLAGTLRWDVLRLWSEIQTGLALAAKRFGRRIVSIGADTWGVDYVLLTKNGEMLGQPFHYRDARTNGWMKRAFKRVSRAEIFSRTGLQFLPFNTLYQLLAQHEQSPDLLARAQTLLLMPDFLHWCLCGARVAELTNASTTQCLEAGRKKWAGEMLKQFGLPRRIFPKLVPPGTRLGTLRPEVRAQTGLGAVRIVAPPTHDTASAVAAMPTIKTGTANWAYISSGTWSLMGVEVARPVRTARARELNVTNEGGVDGTYRLLKNIMGLWLVQQCKRSFDASGRKLDYAQLGRLAARAKPFQSLVDPDEPGFLNPTDMPSAIQNFCRKTRQLIPTTPGELIRCAQESLALKYRRTLNMLEELTGERIEVVHIVGGGSQNLALNQMAADACQRPVVAGPVEATALGNLLVQARADGEIGSLAEIRETVRHSVTTQRFEPTNALAWDEAARRLAAF